MNKKERIDKFKELVKSKAEKEIYKSSIPVNVFYTVGDGGEYTQDEANVMAHFYNNGERINIDWLLNDIRRTYALNSLKDKGVLCNPINKGKWYYLDADKESIINTRQNDIQKMPEKRGLTMAEMEYIDSLIKEVENE